MLPPSQIQFLQEKISDLKSALFFSLSDAVLKIPTSIVSALSVDEVGQVWFFMSRPTQHLQEFDKEFPAKLEFFKKGKNFYLKINGKACIVSDPEELNNLISIPDSIQHSSKENLVLVKFRIQFADYYEQDEQRTRNWMQNLKNVWFKWVYNEHPSFRPYRVEPSYSA